MELKFGQYVWWDTSRIETIRGTITGIEPQTTKEGEQKTTQDGRKKYNIVLQTEDNEVKISIVESQRKFFDYQIGKYGTLTHNPSNNHLTFEEGGEPLYDRWDTKQGDSERKQYDVERDVDEFLEVLNDDEIIDEPVRERYFSQQEPHMLRGCLRRRIERMENDLEWYKQILEALEDEC